MLIPIIFVMIFQTSPFAGIDFHPGVTIQDWTVVDDVVMGGRSSGTFTLDEDGHAVFSGVVSLENNGGFSSVRLRLPGHSVEHASTFLIRLKGEGKRYQFRVKSSRSEWYTYVYEFDTSGDWETIEIPMSEMYPSFRGQKLSIPNFPGSTLAEIGFLIANKQTRDFRLLIDHISVK
jgi:hypothetical protein